MDILREELYRSFRFFYEEANHDLASKGYGLILDKTKNKLMASIASVGFGLSAYIIGVENKYISYDTGRDLVINTFKTFLYNLDNFNGFFPHFVNINDGTPYKKCEYSTIDTVIFFNGAITCDSYFDEDAVHALFYKLYRRLNFLPFIKTFKGKKVFTMAYNSYEDGDYRSEKNNPWIYQWHMYAEQLSMYFLAAGSDSINEPLAKELYQGFERNVGRYKDFEYVYCPTNALFVYQYSHAWLDFRNLVDENHFDWFENSRIATLANRQFSIDHQNEFPIFNESIWGMTACMTPYGYRNQCVLPNDLENKYEKAHGVFPPSGPLGSLPFASKYVFEVLKALETNYMDAFREYGFTDGLTILDGKLWISDEYIGINKGITVLMIDNYLNGTTWKYYMKHPIIQKAINKLGFIRK